MPQPLPFASQQNVSIQCNKLYFLNKYCCPSACRDIIERNKGILSLIPNLCNKWKRVVNFKPQLLLPNWNNPIFHCIGGWVGPRAHLDDLENSLISYLFRESNHGSSRPYPSQYIDQTIPTALSFLNCRKYIKKGWHKITEMIPLSLGRLCFRAVFSVSG
jgi:hypothetical protein